MGIAVLCVIAALLAACGQKGPLYLRPANATPGTATAPAAVAPAASVPAQTTSTR